MKTVKEVLDEYMNRQKEPQITDMLVNISGMVHGYNEVTNLRESENWHLEFDYVRNERKLYSDDFTSGKYHFSGQGVIISKTTKLED